MTWRRLAVGFLLAEAVGGLAWWGLMLAWPAWRGPFTAAGAPDSTLLALAPADLILFVGTAAAVACGLATGRGWAWPWLCVHAGAAGYAALYAWGLVAATGGDGRLGAALMTPSLVVPGALCWALRPRGDRP